MLDRVAVHQTRLRTPGLGLDAKGVALGAKGLVLLPSIDRLVAFLALYTRGGSLADVLRTLSVDVVRSKLGAREVTLTFAAESSDRLDRVAEVARLSGGFTFTGTSRHFVQYRDAGAPFGYDIGQITPSDAALALYHSAFSQVYEVERKIEIRSLLLRLEPHLDPSTAREGGERWIAAEAGLGPALIHYLVRSQVDAEVGVAEWPPASSFDDAPIVRYLFRIREVPARMLPLLTHTPGLSVFVPVAPGVAVESGYRHPVNLRSCPVFHEAGLVLFRGAGRDVLELPKLPALGDVSAFARVELRDEVVTARDSAGGEPATLSIALRLLPTSEPWRSVTASWIRPIELPLLRHIAYALGPETLRRAEVALTDQGAFLRQATGIEGIPVGEFFRELRPGLYIPAGYDAVPAVTPDVLYRALGGPVGQVLFIGRDSRAVGIPNDAFVPLETALLEAQTWAPVDASSAGLEAALATEVPELLLEGVGIRPLRDVQSLVELEKDARALPAARDEDDPLTDELAERAEELAREVLLPLVVGGTVVLRRPFGARLAARLAEGRQIVDLDLRTRIDVARVRRARLLAPVDTLDAIGGTSFALLAALHDLLQATNHELGGPLTRGRYLRLLANVTAVCEATPAPHDIASTLARHATFARVLELVRTDSTVSWWTGSARFRGQEPPSRLLAWPGLRRVRVDAKRVALGDMSRGIARLRDDDFHEALSLWLGRSPLTDSATVTRRAPAFAWSTSTLALVATPPGRSLAFRAIARLPGELATVALGRAANEVPQIFGEARRLVEAFASEVAASHKLAAARSSAR